MTIYDMLKEQEGFPNLQELSIGCDSEAMGFMSCEKMFIDFLKSVKVDEKIIQFTCEDIILAEAHYLESYQKDKIHRQSRCIAKQLSNTNIIGDIC